MRKPDETPPPAGAIENPYIDDDGSVLRAIQELEAMTVRELRAKHLELYGFETKSKHKRQLFKRLAWKVQELKWGGIPQDVLDRLREIENDRDARFLPPRQPKRVKAVPPSLAPQRPRVAPKSPPVGSILEREYDGEIRRVRILDDGVEYEGRKFRSLSGVAREITGTNWNGKRFFGLVDRNGGAK